MLSISNVKSSSAAVHYYEHDDYYAKETNEHKELSEWYGKGAQKLKLEGKVEKEEFKKVLEGELPNGVELGRQENGERVHAPGIDLTFSAPKSVSILAEVYGDKRINEAHDQAVKSVLAYIEKNLAYTRKTADGKTYYDKADNILASLFEHNTSRNLDPQLHTHCILANAIRREDGEWRSAYFGEVFENKLLLGMMYRSELAHSLTELGYTVERTHEDGRFEVKEVPQEIIQTFSSRREEIKAALEEYEYVNAKTAANATLITRQAKTELPKEVLIEKWQETLNSHGFNLEEQKEKVAKEREELRAELNKKSISEKLTDTLSTWLREIKQKFEFNFYSKIGHINEIEEGKQKPTEKSVEERAVEYAIKHLSERASVWDEKELIKVATSYSIGRTTATKILEQIREYKKENKLLENRLESHRDIPQKTLTTKEALSQELQTIKYMQEGKGKLDPITSTRKINEYTQNTELNKGQVDAIKAILTTKDRVVGVQGYAGTGKTYMMWHAKEIARQNGYELIGMAPSASAARTLQNDAGIRSQTISKFLIKYERLSSDKEAKLNKVKMQREMQNKILIVDESSLASTLQFNTLLKISQELDVRLVAIGDTKQLGAVEAGKPFYQLQKAGMETAEMTEIIRQKDDSLKSAVYHSINFRIQKAISKIENNIVEVKKEDLAKTAAEQWLSLPTEKRDTTLVTVPSKKLREQTNEYIREGLKREGSIKGKEHVFTTLESKDMTYAQMTNAREYNVGDIVVFNQDYKSLNIARQDSLKVKEVKDLNVIVLERSNGKQVMWQPHRMGGNKKGGIEVYEEKSLTLQEGEKIRWTRNSAEHSNIINSETSKVLSIQDKNVTFELENGERKTLPLNDKVLKHMNYAYAGTVHASQGKTYNYAISVIEGEHQHLTNQQLFYVVLSRARYEVNLITDNKEKLIETLSRKTGERAASIEHQGLKYTELGNDKIQNNQQLVSKISNIAYDQQSSNLERYTNSNNSSLSSDIGVEQGVKVTTNFIDKALKEASIKEQKIEKKSKAKEISIDQDRSTSTKSTKVKEFDKDNYTTRDIYNYLYSRLPSLLPEFGFKYKSGHYVSTTNQKIDGSYGRSKGKVYVYANNPGVLIDYTRKNISIWEYVKENHIPHASKSEIRDYLLEQAGLKSRTERGIIKQEMTPKAIPLVEEKRVEADSKLLGDIHKFSEKNLFNKENKVLEYLKSERGYDKATIKKMELGYIKNKQELGKYLRAQGYSDEKIKEAYKILGYIGKSHNLVIPYKGEKGEIIGLAGRNIDHISSSEIGKYMYTKGLSRSHTLLNIHNIKGGNEAVIVEGMLDCLHTHAKGIENVVALGGTGFNASQIKLLQDKGINQINLCLDNDKAGNEAVIRIKEIVSTHDSKLGIKQTLLPQNIKDPDQMIQEKGVNELKESLANAKTISIKATELKYNEANITNSTLNTGSNHSSINNNKEIDLEL